MAKKLYPEENIQAIASAIRAKNGSSETYTIGEMAQAIEDMIQVYKAGTIETTFNGIKNIVEINVPDGVTSIARNALNGFTQLKSIHLPDSITSIGAGAFMSCTYLPSIDIPDGVTSIGDSAFHSCSSLQSIDIPDGVTSLGLNVFYGCTSLASITCRSTTPPTIQASTFQGVPVTANIYVPAESVETYKAAQYWSTRADYIQAIPSEG